jgi:hypothetical protein
MIANYINHTNINVVHKHLEIAAYIILAICLIGHVFFIQNQLTAVNLILLGWGTAFAMMVAIKWTPLSNRFSVLKSGNKAEIISFKSFARTEIINKPSSGIDTDRRAA